MALVIVPLTLMQIGSPVSPFMDILALIASVQKVVTFQLYNPFANDASGIRVASSDTSAWSNDG